MVLAWWEVLGGWGGSCLQDLMACGTHRSADELSHLRVMETSPRCSGNKDEGPGQVSAGFVFELGQ